MDKDTETIAKFFEWLKDREVNPISYQKIGRLLRQSDKKEDIKKTTNLVYEITARRKKGKLSKNFINNVRKVFYDEYDEYLKNSLHYEEHVGLTEIATKQAEMIVKALETIKRQARRIKELEQIIKELKE